MTRAIKQSTFFLTDFGRYSAGGENISTPACVPAFPLKRLTAQAPAQQGERAGKVQLNYNQGFQLPEPRGASVLRPQNKTCVGLSSSLMFHLTAT